MSHEFLEGFFVRQPAWHGLGVVLPDFLPLTTEEEILAAMQLAGHDFTLTPRPVIVNGREVPDWQAIVRDNGKVLHVARDTYQPVSNRACWDLMAAIIGQGLKLETAITLREGAICSLLAWLDEPVRIKGDDSLTLPFFNLSWAHDGSGSIKGRPTEVRVVCMNTLSAAEGAGIMRDQEMSFSIRHTKNALARVEDAKMALKGLRAAHEQYVELANDLAEVAITERQREYFVTQFIPSPDSSVEVSDVVTRHIEEAREKVRAIFKSPTVPESHRLTAYGLQLVGVEYLDHIRPYRSKDTYFGRSLLRNEPAKAKLQALIAETCKS